MRAQIIDKLQKAFLVRVPLLGWLVMLASFVAPANSLGKGLFFITGLRPMAAVAAAAVLASAACLINFNLILLGGEFRFGLTPIKLRPLFRFLLAWVPPLTVCGVAIYVSGFSVELLLGVAIGAALATLVILASEVARAILLDPAHKGEKPVCLIWPGPGEFKMKEFVDRAIPAHRRTPLLRAKHALLSLWSWPKSLLEPFLTPGYFEASLRAAHAYAFSAALGSVGFYLYVAHTHRSALMNNDAMKQFGVLPALAWVFLLLVLAQWTLSAATYFLDKFRVPLLLGFAAVASITSGFPEGDHYYRTDVGDVAPAQAVWKRPSAQQLIQARHSSKLVVISAPGGGIQSSAWTDYVLLKLDEAVGGDLMSRVAAISSVSGGSVGVFHLAAHGFKTKPAYEASKLSSIDHVAWGWFVPDLARAIMPWAGDRTLDRGWALEQSLETNAGVSRLYLQDESIQPGPSRPALIMNSTILENGHPIVFATSPVAPDRGGDFPPCGPRIPPPLNNPSVYGATDASTAPYDHWDLYHRKIRLVTAARLSASFPYVSPTARTLPEQPQCGDYHLLDGGYYDNYGVLSLSRWVLDGLKETPLPAGAKKWEILLVRIFAFPDDVEPPRSDGWGNQGVAPVQGVLHARTDSQLMVGRYIRDLVQAHNLDIKVAEFHYDWTTANCKTPPLNWVLTNDQIACIESQPLTPAALKITQDFLGK